MRGGNTDATLVIADDRVESPPTVGSAWAALVMHHEYAIPTLRRIRDGGVVLVNTTVWEGVLVEANLLVVEVPASDLAVDAGNVIAAGMVMLGAFSAATRLVSFEALCRAARSSVPAYRTQHLELNERALEIGAGAVARVVAEAWPHSTSGVAHP
jgi:2-oxoglutarate ferredoxin oxidoreductase subunit gamma